MLARVNSTFAIIWSSSARRAGGGVMIRCVEWPLKYDIGNGECKLTRAWAWNEFKVASEGRLTVLRYPMLG